MWCCAACQRTGGRALHRRVGEGHRARARGRAPAAIGAAAGEVARRARAAARAPTTCRCTSATPEVLEQVTGFVMHRGALASMHRPPLPAGRRAARATPAASSCSRTSSITPTSARSSAPSRGSVRTRCSITPRCADPLYRRVGAGEHGHRAAGAVDAARRSGRAAPSSCTTPDSRSRRSPSTTARVRSTSSPASARTRRPAARHRGRRAEPRRARGRRHGRHDPDARGVDSLNVAAASAVALWALRVD